MTERLPDPPYTLATWSCGCSTDWHRSETVRGRIGNPAPALANGSWLGETLLTIVAGEHFMSSNGFTITDHLSVPRRGKWFFVTAPKGTQVLVVRVTLPRKGVQYNAISRIPRNRSMFQITCL